MPSRFSGHFFAQLSAPDLERLRELTEAGHLPVPIAQPFPLALADVGQAFEQLVSKRPVGKFVLVP